MQARSQTESDGLGARPDIVGQHLAYLFVLLKD